MTKVTTLEELVKQQLAKSLMQNEADTYDLYKHKNGLYTAKSYSDAMASLYAESKRNLSSYGTNDAKINNKGLQNSGFASYVNDLSENMFSKNKLKLSSDYANEEAKARSSYATYLENYKDKQSCLKNSVTSHLIKNEVVDLGTAIAYGISAGLSKEDATLAGQSAYEVTKQKVFNKVLNEVVTLGLDKNGAKMLAIKMGVSENDAQSCAEEINELLEYYGNISEDYLEFLEQRSN